MVVGHATTVVFDVNNYSSCVAFGRSCYVSLSGLGTAYISAVGEFCGSGITFVDQKLCLVKLYDKILE